MPGLFLKGYTLIDPRNSFHNQEVDIFLSNGTVEAIGPAGTVPIPEDCIELNHSKGYVSPGWVDMNAQLLDPGSEHIETLSELSNAAKLGGFTHICCYSHTSPHIDQAQMVQAVLGRCDQLGLKLHLIAAVTRGQKGMEMADLYDMHQTGAKAFGDGSHGLQHPGVLARALLYLQSFNGLLINYPFDERLGGNGQMHEGPVSTKLGLKGIPALGEQLGLVRDIEVLKYTGGRMHFQPLSLYSSALVVSEAKKENVEVSCSINTSSLRFSDDMLLSFDTNLKVFPPHRDIEEVKSLKEAVKEGLVDVLCSGHFAQGLEEKKLSFENASFGQLNLQSSFSIANEALVAEGHINLGRLIELMSINPRKIMGIEDGHVKVGAKADLTLFDPGLSWQLDRSHIFSSASNHPLIDKKLQGRSLGTIFQTSYNIPSVPTH